MQDGIIKGTGNSRYLKSVANALALYPKYEDFIAALVAGTLPVDFNGINTAGWSQQATALNKANLLSDTTETAIWGNTGNRTVDAALAKLDELVDAAQNTADNRVIAGKYTGNGSTDTILTLPVTPRLMFWSSLYDYSGSRDFLFYVHLPALRYQFNGTGNSGAGYTTINQVYIYSGSNISGNDVTLPSGVSGKTYHYVILCG